MAQYVAFLNTVDPEGSNRHNLYSTNESSTEWPKYGQIDFAASVGPGRHYSVASPEWADKPYGFANFLRSARFANSLYNGQAALQAAPAPVAVFTTSPTGFAFRGRPSRGCTT